MAYFKEMEDIILQPNTSSVYYKFVFPTHSTEDNNDEEGFVPYGATVTDVTVVAYNWKKVDVSDTMIVYESLSDNAEILGLSYPGAAGNYKITFIVDMSDGSTDEIDFSQVRAVDI